MKYQEILETIYRLSSLEQGEICGMVLMSFGLCLPWFAFQRIAESTLKAKKN
jgi:hypothetical protein